eukprot:gene4478-4732_t
MAATNEDTTPAVAQPLWDSFHVLSLSNPLQTCCLPAGIDIILQQDLPASDVRPRTFTIILTEGDGTKVYASCLTVYDTIQADLCARHEELQGGRALKALCLLSHEPYMASSLQMLREIYSMAFIQGCLQPLPEVISGLLSVPKPQPGSSKVCIELGQRQLLLCPPLPVGPPPGELSLQPLVESLRPDCLVGLFAAVLLEHRVLLRSQHHWLLTAVAEGLVRLLHPFKYQHVYIPVIPQGLADYLEAPTPFLMGIQSSQYVEPRVLETLVVADLDADVLSYAKDDSLMQRCLNHPYMQRLLDRIRHSDSALLQQIVQGLPFLSFVADNSSAANSGGWYHASLQALQACREAEEQLQAAVDVGRRTWQASHSTKDGGFRYYSFPPLVVLDTSGSEESCSTSRVKRRMNTMRARRASVGKRRAVSELMGQLDMRRTKSGQISINTDSSSPWLHSPTEPLLPPPAAAVTATSTTYLSAAAAAAPYGLGLQAMPKLSTSGSGSVCSLTQQYSIEADLVRRQTGVLVQLMQPLEAKIASGSNSIEGSQQWTVDDLQSAKLLLCVQTGGNGWFLLSRMKEIVSGGGASAHLGTNTASESNPGTPTNNQHNLVNSGKQASHQAADSSSFSRGSDENLQAVADAAVLLPAKGGSCTGRAASSTSGSCRSKQQQSDIDASKSHVTYSISGMSGGDGTCYALEQTQLPSLQASPAAAGPASTMAPAALGRTGVLGSPEEPDAMRPAHQSVGRGGLLDRCTAVDYQAAASLVGSGMEDNRAASHAAAEETNNIDGRASCCRKHCVSSGAYNVLAGMMNSILEVAAYQEDFRVVLAVLEMSCLVFYQPSAAAGCLQPLLTALSGNPVVYTDWFWGGTFSLAVSSTYLHGQEFQEMKDVVVTCLAQFAQYVAGVGISGAPAWMLLMRLSTEFTTHLGLLDPPVLLRLRTTLADQVTRTNSGHMRPAAVLSLTSLTASSPTSSDRSKVGSTRLAMPVVKLWQDGSIVAVGNVHQQSMWVVDLGANAVKVELTDVGAFDRSTTQQGRGVLGLTVHEQGVLAAAGCRDGSCIVWDMRQPSVPLAVCSGHLGPARHIRFLPTASSSSGQPMLLSGSDDWTARLWDASSGKCQAACVGHAGAVTAVQVAQSRAGTRLVTGAADGTVGVWDQQGELHSLVQQHWAPVKLLAQGLDSLVSGALDKTCHIWSVPDVLSCSQQQPPRLLASQPRPAVVCSMAYDPVSEVLCSGHRDGLVSVWNCSINAV